MVICNDLTTQKSQVTFKLISIFGERIWFQNNKLLFLTKLMLPFTSRLYIKIRLIIYSQFCTSIMLQPFKVNFGVDYCAFYSSLKRCHILNRLFHYPCWNTICSFLCQNASCQKFVFHTVAWNCKVTELCYTHGRQKLFIS